MTFISNKDYWLQHAIANIKADYGDTVSAEAKNKDLLKFGRNQLIQTTKTTLMTLPTGIYNEVYLNSNSIDTMSSSLTTANALLQVEGHTVSGGVFTFVTQAATLNGRNKVTLTTPLARCTKAYNNGSVDTSGTVYFYENTAIVAGVPTDGNKVHLMIVAGLNNSEKASTTISNTDYYVVTEFYCDCLEKVATFGIVHLEVRLQGKVFRNVIDISANDTKDGRHEFHPYLVVPKNSDIRLRVTASSNNKDFSGGFEGVLLKVI